MKATLRQHHQSPRKVRLLADLIRGKSIPEARAALRFLPQKSSPTLEKLLNSAAANARVLGVPEERLFVKTIAVNKGAVLRRFKPMARGRAARFARTMSTISLELGTREAAAKKTARKKATKGAAKA